MEWVADDRTFGSQVLETGESSAVEVAILIVGLNLDKRREAALVVAEGIHHAVAAAAAVVLIVLEEVEETESYEVG